jgi:integrase
MKKAGKAKRRSSGEGTVFRRGRDGKWVAELTTGWDAEGKRQVIRHAATTQKEASDWLAARRTEQNQGLLVQPDKLTVGQFAERWLQDVVAHRVKPSSLYNYQKLARSYVIPMLGDIPLQKVTPVMVQRLYAQLLESGKSAKTVRLVHGWLRGLLEQAVEWQLLSRSPAARAKLPREVKPELTILTPEQIRAFLAVAEEDRLHALYALAATTGLRQGELLGLRWQDVNLEEGTLSVVQALTEVGSELVLTTPKSAAGRRTLDLPVVAATALRRWRKEQLVERLALGEAWAQPELVFTTKLGTPLAPSNLRRRSFRPLLQKADCPDVRFHDLRHSAATLMLAQGVQPRVLQEVLGHADIRMTLGRYGHVLREQKKEAARAVDAFLNSK